MEQINAVEVKRGPGRPKKIDPTIAGVVENAVDEANSGGSKPVNIRPRRMSLADKYRDVLTVDKKIPGYTMRWVTERDNRIEKMMDLGYTFVQDTPDGRIAVGQEHVDAMRQSGSVVSKQVGIDQFGKPRVQYLMAQRQEWYDEDQAFKQRKIDEVMEQIRRTDQADGITLSVKDS